MVELEFTESEFGGYIEFHHEPAQAGIAMAVEKIYEKIASSISVLGVVKLGEMRVVYRNADDYERSRMEIGDELFRVHEVGRVEKTWTVGVKIRVWHAACTKEFLHGIETSMLFEKRPDPLMIVE